MSNDADTSRHQIILNTLTDVVSNFLYYDRKEDEELGRGEVEEAVDGNEITIDEMVAHFRKHLLEGLNYEEDGDGDSPEALRIKELEAYILKIEDHFGIPPEIGAKP